MGCQQNFVFWGEKSDFLNTQICFGDELRAKKETIYVFQICVITEETFETAKLCLNK